MVHRVVRCTIIILPFSSSSGKSVSVSCYKLSFGTLIGEGLRNILTKFGPSTTNALVPPLGRIWKYTYSHNF